MGDKVVKVNFEDDRKLKELITKLRKNIPIISSFSDNDICSLIWDISETIEVGLGELAPIIFNGFFEYNGHKKDTDK